MNVATGKNSAVISEGTSCAVGSLSALQVRETMRVTNGSDVTGLGRRPPESRPSEAPYTSSQVSDVYVVSLYRLADVPFRRLSSLLEA